MHCVTGKVADHSPHTSILPVEIIRHILLSLDPRELIRLQTISKQFHAIISDSIFWRTLYSDARLPRPPGPFSWQSTEFLQRTLVRSARLQQSWTSQPVKVVSTRSVQVSAEEWRWVGGRWLIVCTGMTQLVSHDVDTGSGQALYQSDDRLRSWSATCCRMSTRGLLLYVVLHTAGASDSVDKVKLLEFKVEDDSRRLSGPIIHDVPISLPSGHKSVSLTSGDTPFVFIFADVWRMRKEHAVIFDTRRQIFYKFPELRLEMDPTLFSRPSYHDAILTTTHVVLCYYVSSSSRFAQAYIIPDDNETRELRLSHETITPIRILTHESLLQNSIVDPTTGSTRLRILHKLRLDERECLCTDIILPASPAGEVLPMLIDTHAAFAIDEPIEDPGTNLVESSIDGFARGMYIIAISKDELQVQRFSIDATGERCVAVFGDTSTLPLPAGLERFAMTSFHGVRGRVCISGVDTTQLNASADVEIAVDFE